MPRLTNKPLTQRIIDTTPLPKTGMTTLRDATVRGLSVRIFPSGSRTWSLEYRSPLSRKNARVSFEATSLVEARAIAQQHRVTLDQGRDPNQERKDAVAMRRVEHARAVIVSESLNKYEPGFLADAPLKQDSRRDRMHRLRRILSPLMDRAVSALTQEEMILFLDEVQETSGPIARNRAHAEIRAWLGWACRRAHAPANVLDRVPKEVSEKNRERRRVLTDAELSAMVSATADGAVFSDYVRVLLHSGMRRNEAASLQKRDLDFAARTMAVRELVGKTGYRVIPMAEAIAPMLEERARGLSPEGYIFGEATHFRSPFQGWHKPTERLRAALPPGDHWTLHDIRRTVVTRLHMAKVHPLTIEDLVGHTTGLRGGVAGVYNVADTIEDQRLALADWAAKLASLTNVVTLKRRVA